MWWGCTDHIKLISFVKSTEKNCCRCARPLLTAARAPVTTRSMATPWTVSVPCKARDKGLADSNMLPLTIQQLSVRFAGEIMAVQVVLKPMDAIKPAFIWTNGYCLSAPCSLCPINVVRCKLRGLCLLPFPFQRAQPLKYAEFKLSASYPSNSKSSCQFRQKINKLHYFHTL